MLFPHMYFYLQTAKYFFKAEMMDKRGTEFSIVKNLQKSLKKPYF